MKNGYLLDACALIAYLNDEDGADVVDTLISQSSGEDVTVSMGMVNLLEVYYGIFRDYGADEANRVLDEILLLPIGIISGLSYDVFREAGRLKAGYKVSLADSVALGLASVSGNCLVTADHHEMDIIEQNEPIKFLWIR